MWVKLQEFQWFNKGFNQIYSKHWVYQLPVRSSSQFYRETFQSLAVAWGQKEVQQPLQWLLILELQDQKAHAPLSLPFVFLFEMVV